MTCLFFDKSLPKRFGVLLGCVLLFHLNACSFGGLQENLSRAMLNNPDPETVKEAMPTFLIATDALIASEPKNPEHLQKGAELYGAFAVLFIDDQERARRLVNRAQKYGEQALCYDVNFTCDLDKTDFEGFVEVLNKLGPGAVPSLYAYTVSWLSWARFHSDDWTVAANLPKYRSALKHIIALDEDYRHGSAHIYLGILESLRPPSLGGDPETARRHFERAIKMSDGRNLSAKLELARSYARLVYDRDLHDRILQEVLEAPVEAPGLTLQNVLAKRQASDLLKNADDYF